MDFRDLVENDVNDVFLSGKEFNQTAIFKSKTTLKEIEVQFFESSLDQMDTTYFHAWCATSDVIGIAKNDTLEINSVIYGIMDFSPDEFQSGMNVFLQKV